MAVLTQNLKQVGAELASFPITPGSEFPASYGGQAYAARWMWCTTGGSITYTDRGGLSVTTTVAAGYIPLVAIAVASFGGTGLRGYV